MKITVISEVRFEFHLPTMISNGSFSTFYIPFFCCFTKRHHRFLQGTNAKYAVHGDSFDPFIKSILPIRDRPRFRMIHLFNEIKI